MIDKELRSALVKAYMQLGWKIVPMNWPINPNRCSCHEREKCESVGKHPVTKGWKEMASSDPTEIESWFKIWENCNIAVKTGPESGVVVIDIESYGYDTWKNWCAKYNYPEKPNTLISETGRKGHHYYFKHPGFPIKNKVKIAHGIDVRGDNGLATLPPSQNEGDGETLGDYDWVEGKYPLEMPLAEMPDWLVALISADQLNSLDKERLDILSTLSGVPEGERDIKLFRLACKLRNEDIPIELAETMLVTAAQNCDPPVPEKLALEKVRNAYKTYQPKLSWEKPFIKKAITNQEVWQKPIDFGSSSLPEFPVEVFPSVLRDYIVMLAEDKQTPIDLPGMCVLSVLSAACARKFVVLLKETWKEPVNLYTLTVVEPGGGKSPVFQAVLQPIKTYEKALQYQVAIEVAKNQVTKELLKKKYEKQVKELATMDEKAGEELRQETARIKERLDNEELMTSLPKLLVDDITQEKLAIDLSEQNGHVAILSPEGGIFENMAGLYSNGSPKLDIFLKAHAGDDFRDDRVGRASSFIPRPALTLGLTVQPDVLRGLIAKPSLKGRGMLARFLYSMPKSMIGRRKFHSPIVPPSVASRFNDIVVNLLNIQQSAEKHPYELTCNPEALEVLQKFSDWVNLRLAPGGGLDGLTDWAGKLVGHVARLAGLLHLSENSGESNISIIPIGPETMDGACILGRYFAEHAIEANEEMIRDNTTDDAVLIARWLKEEPKKRITKVNVAGRVKRSGYKLDKLLTILQDYGYIRPEDPNAIRPRVFEVNPYLYEREITNKDNSDNVSVSSIPTEAII